MALACGLMFSFLYLNVLRNKTRKFFIITYLLPSILYASIGFDEVYEMREREYINQMFQDFDSVNFNELRKLNDLSYKEDAIYYYYYKYYDEYSKYLNHQYKGVSWYEFESILLKDNIITN